MTILDFQSSFLAKLPRTPSVHAHTYLGTDQQRYLRVHSRPGGLERVRAALCAMATPRGHHPRTQPEVPIDAEGVALQEVQPGRPRAPRGPGQAPSLHRGAWYTGCIAPLYREVAALLSTKSALMEPSPASYLDGVYPAKVKFTWLTQTLGQL